MAFQGRCHISLMGAGRISTITLAGDNQAYLRALVGAGRLAYPDLFSSPETARKLIMDVILVPLIGLVVNLLDLFQIVIICSVVLSWLTAFNVINTQNRFVYLVGDFLHRVTDRALRPIRNFMPNLGGLDLSPVILILLIYAAQEALVRLAFRLG